MKPVYQFPIPPLRPFSSTSSAPTPLNAAADRNEVSMEPLPKRMRRNDHEDEIAQQQHVVDNAFENRMRLFMNDINAQEPSTAPTVEVA